MARKKYRGQFCWACNKIRPNERFSGGGHARHICRDCQKLDSEELAYRQEIRNIHRCLEMGTLHRKHRKPFERFLSHTNPRVREYAQRMKLEMEVEQWELDEDPESQDEDSITAFTDEEIPF